MIPVRHSYSGQSYKLFQDYNEVHVFVEDADFENLYEVLFNRCGANIFKVFSINGSVSVVETAITCKDPKCVYIIDRDWNDLLGSSICLPNLVTLKRHSIENYLIDYKGFSSIVMCDFPREKIFQLLGTDHFEEIIIQVSNIMRPLFECFVAMQMCSGDKKKGCSHNPGHFQVKNSTCAPDKDEISKFICDSAVTVSTSVIEYFSDEILIGKGHGKFMLHYVWEGIRQKTKVSKIAIDKLMMRLAYLIDISELQPIVSDVMSSVQSRSC